MVYDSSVCDSCALCKNYLFQSGGCFGKNKRCNHYEEEPRGHKHTKRFVIGYSPDNSLTIQEKTVLTIVKDNKELPIEVRRILAVDLEQQRITITAAYYEHDLEEFDAPSKFRVIDGGIK